MCIRFATLAPVYKAASSEPLGCQKEHRFMPNNLNNVPKSRGTKRPDARIKRQAKAKCMFLSRDLCSNTFSFCASDRVEQCQ